MYQDAWLQCFTLVHFSSSLRMAPGPCSSQQVVDIPPNLAPAVWRGGSSTSLWTSIFISAPHYLFIWDSSHCLPKTFNPCILPSKLEHLDVEWHSSTFLKTQVVKIWSILSQCVFYWFEWGDQSQKLVRLFWHSRQFVNMNSPSFSLYETTSTYGGENRQAEEIMKMLLEARSCSGW